METLLNGRYRIIRPLGSGGMSTVYLAESLSLGNLWAVKVIDRSEKRFDLLAEPNILKRLHHPALPRIVDIAQDDRYLYIVEDYIQGVSLDQQLKVQRRFDEATVAGWGIQLCQVLTYLHTQRPRPIIYRDLKPANLIVSQDNRVQLIDFGIAREYKAERQGDTAYMGTRGYAAPEQYGSGQTDPRTDIYALGMTLYHLLTGRSPSEPPFAYDDVRRADARLSEGIAYVVARCVRSNPADRYQSAAQVEHDLRNLHLFNAAYRRQRRRERAKYTAMALCTLASAALIAGGAFLRFQEQRADFDAAVAQGYQLIGQSQFEAAAEQLDRAEAIFPDDPAPDLGRAQILLRQGDYQGCLDALAALAQSDGQVENSGVYHYLTGEAYLELGRYEPAIQALEQACTLSPDQADYARDLAICYARTGQVDQARAVLNRPVLQDAQTDDAALIEAQLLVQAGDTAGAEEALTRLAQSSQDPEIRRRALMSLSGLYQDLRSTDPDAPRRQIAVLEQALSDPELSRDPSVLEALAGACYAAGETERAEALFLELIDMGLQQPYFYRNVAIIRQEAGDFDGAAEILAQMEARFPDDYTCYLQLAYLTLEAEGVKDQSQRDYHMVETYYNQAVSLAPDGADTPALQALKFQIDQLYAKGWL